MKGIAGMRGRVEDGKTRDTFEWSFYKQLDKANCANSIWSGDHLTGGPVDCGDKLQTSCFPEIMHNLGLSNTVGVYRIHFLFDSPQECHFR